jgi:predicted nucleic acid-binding Zn ribbon protein
MLIRLCIEYPVIGIPVVVIIIFFFVAGGQRGTTAYQSSVLRRGGDVMEQNAKNQSLLEMRQHDPNFSEPAFCQRVSAAFFKIQNAWVAQDLKTVRPFISDGVYERFLLQFAEQKAVGYRDQLQNVALDGVSIADVSSTGVFDEIAVRIGARAADFRVSLTDGRIVGGSTDVTSFVEIWTFLRKRGAVTDTSRRGLMEGHCPNCGAPIEMNESASCTQCKALLRSGQFDWVLSEITQASEWDGGNRPDVASLAPLRAQDPGFDPVAVEDRVSVMFWRKAAADRLGKIDPLRKVAEDGLCETYAKYLQANSDGERRYIGECAVGAVHVLGYVPAGPDDRFERLGVEVCWSGMWFSTRADGKVRPLSQPILTRSLFIIGRNAGSKTEAGGDIISAHCPNCGAPFSDAAANACEYCKTVLNDGGHGWILLDMPVVTDPRARQFLLGLNGSPRAPLRDAGLLAWAVKTAAADGTIDDREKQLLANFASQREIGPDQLNWMMTAAMNGSLETPAPANPEELRMWLTAMAKVAQADGVLSRPEIDLLETLGRRGGLSDYDLKLLLRQAQGEQYQAAQAALRGNRINAKL